MFEFHAVESGVDHLKPIAKGGRSTVENVRLLCRAHNQLEAGRAFGHGFMHAIRERARGTWSGGARSGPREATIPVAPPPLSG